MKKFVKIIVLFLAVISIGSFLCACGTGAGKSNEKSEIEAVRSAVEAKGMFAYMGSTIGGNDLKSSEVTITNTQQDGPNKYIVNGKIVMIDIYGTRWSNTFDCEVTRYDSNSEWSAGKLEYRSNSWNRN